LLRFEAAESMADATTGCVLSAMGMVNALGRDPEESWPRLLAGDQSCFRVREDLVPGRRLLVAEVAGPLPAVPERLSAYACRNNSLALAAIEQIHSEISEALNVHGRDRVGVVIGTSTCGVSEAEAAIRVQVETGRLASAFDYAQLEYGGAASFVAELLGVGGPAYTISTACSSGARALVSARSLLALDVCDAVICGAADSLCGLTTNGFTALQAISETITNPCSANRDGLTLGEGSVMFLATRGAEGVRLSGIGESSEAHHMSAPDPGGAGAESAMRQALEDAQRAPEDVAYLNLHGTGTPLNDAMECPAITRVFEAPPLSSSTKPLVGHTLGAAGGMEAGFCWLMLRNAEAGQLLVPPHCFDGEVDEALAGVPLAAPGMRAPVGAVMTNSFGFGGNNCTLVLELEAS